METTVNINTLWRILLKRKLSIILVTCIVGIASFLYYYKSVPKRFNTQASVMFSSTPSISNLFNIESVGDFVSGAMMKGSSVNFEAILNSRSLREKVFARPGIEKSYTDMARYKGMPYRQIVAKEKNLVEIKIENKMLFISYQGPSGKIAADITNAYAEELIEFVNNQKSSVSRDQRIFIEKELDKIRAKLAELEEIIKEFEEINPEMMSTESDAELVHRYSALNMQKEQLLIELSTMEKDSRDGGRVYDWAQAAEQMNQTMAEDPTIIYLRQQLAEYNLEMAHKSELLDKTHPTMIKMREQIADTRSELQSEIRKQYKGKKEYLDSILSILGEYDENIQEFPTVKMEYTRMMREFEILNKVYAMLYAEYQMLRVQELRRDHSLTILDEAISPLRKTYPQTVKMTLVFATATFLLMSCLMIIIDIRPKK